jgi:RNA polymerase sigma factor (sigma-70 family)
VILDKRFEELVEQYSSQVLNTALRVLGNSELANDVHQEVFLSIWQRWHKFNGRLNWSAYLYKVTVRKAIDLAKRSRKGLPIQLGSEQQTTTEEPDAAMREEQLQQQLAQCLAKLPKRQADAFVLSRIEGLAYEKIAEMLGCSESTVRVHLHRATKNLTQLLRNYLD